MAVDPGLYASLAERFRTEDVEGAVMYSKPKDPGRFVGLFRTRYGFRDWVLWTAGVVAVLSIIGALIGAAVAVDYRTCAKRADGLHLAHRFDLLAGTCFVMISDGRQVDIDQLRFNEQGQIVETQR